VIIVLVTSLIKVVKDKYQGQKTTHALVKEKLQTELKFLKAQINPHFLFNTLNSIYSLSLHQSPQTPEAILKLSHLMSYMLYETGQKEVPLDKEITYLHDYIALEKLRSGDYVEVNFTVSGTTENVMIAPVLLLPFVENSFKHLSESDTGKGWIRIHIDVKEEKLTLTVENAADATASEAENGKTGGVGLPNVKRRLALLYKDHYTLVSLRKPHSYLVTLQVNVKEKPVFKPFET
jgi:LytS/YehU family sensor histidine kinase